MSLSDVGARHRLTLQNGLGNFSTFFTHFLNNLTMRAKTERRKIFKDTRDTIQKIFQMRNFIFTSKRHNIFRNKLLKRIAIKKYNG